MKWKDIPFERHYAAPSRNGIYKTSEFHGGGCRIVNMGELFGFDFISNQEMKRLEMSDAELTVNSLEDGDLLFGRRSLVEAGAGKCSIVIEPPEPLTFESSIIRVRLNKQAVNPRFFYYYFRSPQGRGRIRSIVSGTNVKGIRGSDLKRLLVETPHRNIQDKIADILSAYDESIESNRRRMDLLQKATRLLYQEWFTSLCFPGHEHIRITNGIPNGWERKPLAELCESINYGYTASANKEVVGPKMLRITDIVPDYIDWPNVPHCPIEDERLEKFRLREGDIVIARTGATVGYAKRLHKRHPDAVFASYLVRLRLKPETDNLMVGVFVESQEYKNYIQSRIGGAAQPNANAKVLSGAEILVPPARIQRDFHEFVEPLIDQRETLEIQNQKLRAARDLLLPRLMSGEIAV